MLSQGCGISDFERDKISNSWILYYRDIPQRKLITALRPRANVYPTRKFLARGRQETQIKSCQYCKAENETCSHIIGCCPAVQDARIEGHNQLCELLADKAKKKDWVVFQKLLLKCQQNKLYKPDLVFVKGDQAFGVDITLRYESKLTSLVDAAVEKVKKYQHFKHLIQELRNGTSIKFIGFPLRAWG